MTMDKFILASNFNQTYKKIAEQCINLVPEARERAA